MILVLLLLPPLSGWLAAPDGASAAPGLDSDLWQTLLVAVAKIGVFIALMLVVGRRVFPKLLSYIAGTGSRELFTLCVIAVAMGIAYGSAALFGASFALGAFFAGMVMRESNLSHRAAAESLPLRDAFSVLFFVSVGMLFDPAILVEQPLQVLAVVAIIVMGKSLAAFLLVLAFRYPMNTALTVSASLAQIGEFSFILAGLGVSLGLLPQEGMSLILAGALISISLNHLIFQLIDPVRPASYLAGQEESGQQDGSLSVLPMEVDSAAVTGHILLVGYGRVGRPIGESLAAHGLKFVVAEQSRELVEELRAQDINAVVGDASDPAVLVQAHIVRAGMLVIATPDLDDALRMIEVARTLNPDVDISVRTHSEEQAEKLREVNAGTVFIGEYELALSMKRYVLEKVGVTSANP